MTLCLTDMHESGINLKTRCWSTLNQRELICCFFVVVFFFFANIDKHVLKISPLPSLAVALSRPPSVRLTPPSPPLSSFSSWSRPSLLSSMALLWHRRRKDYQLVNKVNFSLHSGWLATFFITSRYCKRITVCEKKTKRERYLCGWGKKGE